ncbi:PEP-CTERM sorting domain-containing protein [Crateriforma conspicua]|uniref:Uncharacterized protein n=1 Tax=Crateriforma conspicua TaxID=2527996 RepID=A0A5C5Y4V0_9PLAN|nr:PEP-CTERM sorting domain-containing protein [Crateriforma conspicua]QDV62814.1 hypothetical protein Mal65_19500 [Crateriforma conspicua]TWT68422.1 hypothetical protein Pan14r_06670 [Crateriforma conspicua]
MHRFYRASAALFAVLAAILFGTPASAEIVLDYTHDTGFFSSNATAKAALEAAASDINAVLNLNLDAITDDTVTGNGGGGTVLNFDFRYQYTNPATGASVTVNDTTTPANEIRIYVGMRNLTGSTLGQGGSGGSGIAIGGVSGSGPISAAIADAQASYQHRRNEGPVIGTLSGNVSGNSFSFEMGPALGNLWFDQDTNNDGATDSAAVLNANWHFDHTTSVAAGKDDFYSVALHEMLHSIGFGGSETWDDLVSGTDWLGSEVIDLNGTGTGIIDGGGAHFAAGLMSTRITDGMAQEVVMDPTLTTGTRKYLTDLDVALLRDIGYLNASAVPEPSTWFALAMIGGGACYRRRRQRAKQSMEAAADV